MGADREVWEAAADLLRAGHDVMLDKGRCPEGVTDSDGRFCMAMALSRARHMLDSSPRLHHFTVDVLRQHCGTRYIGLFNDDPATTDDMCFDAFITAEKNCRDRAARLGDGSPAAPGGES